MFEKEAKKRARDFTDNEGRQVAYECGFLDGEEFVGVLQLDSEYSEDLFDYIKE